MPAPSRKKPRRRASAAAARGGRPRGGKKPRPRSAIYQLKVQLAEISPPVWRSFLVPGNYTLGRLHQALQDVMGWSCSHLHLFRDAAREFGSWEEEMEDCCNEAEFTLAEVLPSQGDELTYEYDFGDGWEHQIVVEAILPEHPIFKGRPVCLAGARACPPEDCGGPFGYQSLLQALRRPKNACQRELREWAGGYDPEAFDLDEVNDLLYEG